MTGDISDFTKRIKSTLPRWFGDTTTYLDAVITGLANGWSFSYSLYVYAKLQTRIKSATDGWLDFIAWDFFGTTLQRQTNQSDTSFRARILINLFRERGTRNAITKVLLDITGRAPIIFEPKRPLDTGAYGTLANGISVNGYGLAGGYGSMLLPYQCFVTAYRPASSGIPNVAGYGSLTGYCCPVGAYYSPSSQAEYASMSMIQGAVTDADIFAAIDSVTTAGTTAWTNILS